MARLHCQPAPNALLQAKLMRLQSDDLGFSPSRNNARVMNHPKVNQDLQGWSSAYRRLAIITLLMGASVWPVLCYPYQTMLDPRGRPLGGDYVMLYVAGTALADGESATLYDDCLNQRRTRALFPPMQDNQSWPYRYPPTVAACMVPLSMLPFGCSYLCFVGIQLLLLAITLRLLSHMCSAISQQPNWLWAIAGCPLIVFENLVGGQSALLAVCIVVSVIYCLRAGKPALAGALLAVALYKPNVLALFVLACLIAHPRMLLGFVPVSLLGFTLGACSVGYGGMAEYLQLGSRLASTPWDLETPYWKVHGLVSIFQSIAPQSGRLLCCLTGLSLALLIGCLWRANKLDAFAATSGVLIVNSLFNPYVPIYDLSLLIIALAFAVEASRTHSFLHFRGGVFAGAVACLFFAPHLSQSLCKMCGLQFFPVLVLCGLSVVVYRWMQLQRQSVAGWLAEPLSER